MMKLLSDENDKEQERVAQLDACPDAIVKQELNAVYGIQRSRAQKLIEKTMRAHQDELKALEAEFAQ